MFGYSPKLPILRDPRDGFVLTKSIQEAVQQNLKNLILTSPGERVMDPSFGVGVRAYLFQHNTPDVRDEIEENILVQANKYMPFVSIHEIQFGEDADMPEKLYILIEYSIAGIKSVDLLQIAVVL